MKKRGENGWRTRRSSSSTGTETSGPFRLQRTNNVSLNRYKQNTADKRGGGEVPAVLEEIAELVSDTDSVEQEVDRRELVKAIDAFLERLPTEKRSLFLCRYWYFDSVSNLASRFGMTENHVSVTLNRLRRKLHNDLLERGFDL